MNLTKARIEILDRDAIDESRGLPAHFDVQFNPTQYGLSKGAQIAEIAIPGIDSPILQFIRGQTEKLSLELFFDSTGDGLGGEGGETDIRERTKSIYQLVKMQPRTHAPPRIRFLWGSLAFVGVVESVQQKFTLFSPSGIPLRATVNVSIKEYKTLEEQLKELNLQSSDHSQLYAIQAGQTLSQIAGEVYGNPALWRVLANHQANRALVTDPRRLTPGAELHVPPLKGSDAASLGTEEVA